MDYKIQMTTGLYNTKKDMVEDYLPNNFIPRIGDTIVWKGQYWDVKNVVIDYAYNEIRIWVMDSMRFVK